MLQYPLLSSQHDFFGVLIIFRALGFVGDFVGGWVGEAKVGADDGSTVGDLLGELVMQHW